MMQEKQQFVLGPATHVGLVTIVVSSLESSLHYYQAGLGFTVKAQHERTLLLGAEVGIPILALVEQPNAQSQPAPTTGLYHFAILLPTRKDLGQLLAHLVATRMSLDGYADHLVSEALYLSDPDGNGIEVYRDRQRSEWSYQNGQVPMVSDPIDLQGLIAEGRQDSAEWMGLPAGTMLGHIHLRIGDIAQAEQFYVQLLGFAVMQRSMPGALFVSAGGYHHHIGLNTWQSRNAPPPPANAVGLRFFTIELPNAPALAQVVARLQAVNWPLEQQDAGVIVRDPWGNKILLTTHTIASAKKVEQIVTS